MKKRNLAIAFGGAVGAAVAVKLLTRADTVKWDMVADDVVHSDRSHFVNVDGARVHYQEFGDATNPPMILIHGYTASVYVWKTAAPMLAEAGFRVIAVDLLGFGYSEKPAWFDYSIQGQARMISRFMNRLGIGRATIVGSSYGGAVALNLTLDYPEYVEKLVLVDAVCNDEPKNHPILKLASVPGIGEAITPFLCDSKAFMRFRMQGTLAPANHHMITEERIESIRRPLYAADGHHSVLATSRNWHADRLEQDAHQINQQTLIIWGDQDNVIPIKNGYKLHEEILNSRFVILKDCGHVPQEEKSQLFTELVSEFAHDRKGKIEARDGDEVRLGYDRSDAYLSKVIAGIVGIAYSAIFFFLSMNTFGGGHGTAFFLAMSMPFPFGLLFFPIIAVVAADMRTRAARIVFLVVQGIHFGLMLCGFALYIVGKSESLLTVWPIVRGAISTLFAMYFIAQAGLWFTFAKFYGGVRSSAKGSGSVQPIKL